MPLRDLTHPIEDGMQTYPGDPPVSVSPAATMADDGARVTALSLGSHTGTHVDAPAHTEADGATLGAFDIDDFRFSARLVDVTDLDDREAIGPGRLPDRVDADCLVFHTGWDRFWGTDRYLDHPHLGADAAEWCAERGLAVATDTLSPDPTPSASSADHDAGFPAHHALLGAGRLILENLTDLDGLPERFTLHAFPLSLDGDGAPVRAVAEW